MQVSKNFFLLFLAMGLSQAVDHKKPVKQIQKKRIFVDGVKAVFRGSEGVDVVLASEANRPKLDGSPNNLQDTLTNLAFAQEARRYKIFPTPEEAKNQFSAIATNNNKTEEQFKQLIRQAGFTVEEAINEFAQINAVNSLINFKVTGNMVVPESEVIAYYEENPEYEPAAYQIQVAVVPFSVTQSREQQLAQLQTLANAKDPNGVLNWGEAFWVNEEDLAADKKFITKLAPTEISLPKELFNGFEMFRMVSKRSSRLKTLDERYGQIVTLLRRPKYTELMTKFQKDLMNNASIIIFDLPL